MRKENMEFWIKKNNDLSLLLWNGFSQGNEIETCQCSAEKNYTNKNS